MVGINGIALEKHNNYLDRFYKSMSSSGRDEAIDRCNLEKDDFASLRGQWEYYHLLDYKEDVVLIKGKKTVEDAIVARGIDNPHKVSRYPTNPSLGAKTKDIPENVFQALTDVKGCNEAACFVDFLEFCRDCKKYGAQGLPLNFFNNEKSALEAAIIELKNELKSNPDEKTEGQHKEQLTPENTGKAFDGINIFWEKGNNEHDKATCKVQPCYGEEHLIIPNTHDNIDLEQPSTVLRWSSNISSFIGRGKEILRLQNWLKSDVPKSIQLISGAGGVGKTRLAFHFSEEAISSKEWTAGQTTGAIKGRWYMGDKGMLLIIDYPEERKLTVTQFLRAVYEMDDLPNRMHLRVLLLSRDPNFLDVIEEAAPGLSSMPIFLTDLDTNEKQWELVEDAWRGLQYQRRKAADVDQFDIKDSPLLLKPDDFVTWQKKQTTHSTALMVLALAYYIFDKPDAISNGIVELTGQNIIRYMTKREIKFVRKEVEEYFGVKKLIDTFKPESIFLLKAMAAIASDFNDTTLPLFTDDIHNSVVKFQLPDVEHIQELSLWKNKQFAALTPDILAADFLAFCLEKYAKTQAADWVFAATGLTQVDSANVNNRYITENFSTLGRLIFDAKITLKAAQWPVEEIAKALTKKIAYCTWVADNLATKFELEPHLHLLNDSALGKCLQQKLKPQDEARYQVAMSTTLAQTGRLSGALKTIKHAVGLFEVLAKDNPAAYTGGLALSLMNQAVHLGENNQTMAALEVIQRAVTLYETLAKENPAAYTGYLAQSLTNLSNYLAENNQTMAALEVIQRAVTLYETLAKENPAAYTGDLAKCLVNLSIGLAENNQKMPALEAIQRVVTRYETLAKDNPAVYTGSLAKTLMNLSIYLAENDQKTAALEAVQRAVTLYESLAEDNPAAYTGDLAKCLMNLSIGLAENNQKMPAREAIQRAITHYETLANDNPAVYTGDLALSLMNQAIHLGENNQKMAAFKAIQRAVSLYEALAKENPAFYTGDLAFCLINLSIHLGENNQKIAALEVMQRTVTLYETLAKDNPAAYTGDLARSLTNMSIYLAEYNQKDKGLEVIRRAVALNEILVKDNPMTYREVQGECLTIYCNVFELHMPYLIQAKAIYLQVRNTCHMDWVMDFTNTLNDLFARAKQAEDNEAIKTIAAILQEINA